MSNRPFHAPLTTLLAALLLASGCSFISGSSQEAAEEREAEATEPESDEPEGAEEAEEADDADEPSADDDLARKKEALEEKARELAEKEAALRKKAEELAGEGGGEEKEPGDGGGSEAGGIRDDLGSSRAPSSPAIGGRPRRKALDERAPGKPRREALGRGALD